MANTASNSSYNGLFTWSSTGNCYITVYRNNTVGRNILMGTVLHELGHFIHFRERGGTDKAMSGTDKLLQESLANYVGWYLTEKYYSDLGYVKPSAADDPSGQARQRTWTRESTGSLACYSPLFVDLVDGFDQSTLSSSYNRDRIKETHYSVIMRIAGESADWASCKAILYEELVEKSKTVSRSDLDAFLEPYDYWYSRNSP
jgi:hypothetical protein